jgi:hypothetical protein
MRMEMMNVLSQQEIHGLFEQMDEELYSHSQEFVFTQLRMSAEHYVVPLCGFAIDRVLRILKPNQFHLYFEKKLLEFRQGPIDLVVIPVTVDGVEDQATSYCFEFKMVWLGGIQSNLEGIQKDFNKLNGYSRGFIVAVLFSFDNTPKWVPYTRKGDMKKLVEKVITEIGRPIFEGPEHKVTSIEAEGMVKLMAWSSHR